jgi:DNA-directed RNA polymerase subunit RPC12/RpoP
MGNVVSLVKCPNCSREIEKPVRSLNNHFFILEAYVCGGCSKHFHIQKQNTEL